MSSQPSHVAIRDAIFQHEMFAPDMIRNVETGNRKWQPNPVAAQEVAWGFEIPQIRAEMQQMEAEGLLVGNRSNYWYATREGILAAERLRQARGERHPALKRGDADLEDVLLALVRSGGEVSVANPDYPSFHDSLPGVYLPDTPATRIEAAIDALVQKGMITTNRHLQDPAARNISLSIEGRKQYVQAVIGRLGLHPPRTVLAPVEIPSPPFMELGLSASEADTLQFLWDEATRCAGARAWLATTALYGSIIEAVLQAWLSRNEAAALAAPTARRIPRRGGHTPAIREWQLVDLIKVAAELGYIDAALRKHADVLRSSRNLIHPGVQLREGSRPTEGLAQISLEVARALSDLFARAART